MLTTAIVIVFLVMFIWNFQRKYREKPIGFRILFYLGVFGFGGSILSPSLGRSIWWLELPAIFETKTLQAPDGRYFSANLPLQRIQRYDSKGQFELGWFVHAAGGSFLIGITKDGNIASASARKDHLEIFKPDGSYQHPPIGYGESLNISYFDDTLRPSDFKSIDVNLLESELAENPKLSFVTALLFPLWHPVVGWLMTAIGGIGAAIYKPIVNQQSNEVEKSS